MDRGGKKKLEHNNTKRREHPAHLQRTARSGEASYLGIQLVNGGHAWVKEGDRLANSHTLEHAHLMHAQVAVNILAATQ